MPRKRFTGAIDGPAAGALSRRTNVADYVSDPPLERVCRIHVWRATGIEKRGKRRTVWVREKCAACGAQRKTRLGGAR